jgi:hypothetical protein
MVRQLVRGREGINLISALAHVAKQAFNGIGAANVAVNDLPSGSSHGMRNELQAKEQ